MRKRGEIEFEILVEDRHVEALRGKAHQKPAFLHHLLQFRELMLFETIVFVLFIGIGAYDRYVQAVYVRVPADVGDYIGGLDIENYLVHALSFPLYARKKRGPIAMRG